MKETITLVDTAFLAKQKGFNHPPVTREYWDDSGGIRVCPLELFEDYKKYNPCWVITQSLLAKWLRKEHDIIVTPCGNSDDAMDSFLNCKRYETVVINKGVCKHDTIDSDDHDEAFELGLVMALNMI